MTSRRPIAALRRKVLLRRPRRSTVEDRRLQTGSLPIPPNRSSVLQLVRHAKSSWADRSTTDIDRPLSTRGLQAAEALARHIADAELRPDIVVCSPAKRARQTLAAIEGILPTGAEIRVEPLVYEAGAEELLTTLRDLPAAFANVMVIGHNPTMQELTLRLMSPEDADRQARIRDKFPTAAMAVLSFPPGWDRWAPGSAHLDEFWTPR